MTAHDDLDAAIRRHVAESGGPPLVTAWVLITECVEGEGAPGATVVDYGASEGTSWATTAGLLRWAERQHERLDP